LPKGLAFNAAAQRRAEVLAQVRANCEAIKRLLHPPLKGLTLRGSVEDWA